MKFFYFLLFTFYFLLFLACRPSAAPIAISNKPISINGVSPTNLPVSPSKPLAEMTWTSFEGKPQKLGELKGKVIILDFWATYCPPCLEEIPHLNELQTKYGAENLQIVGLNAGGDDDLARVPAFAKKLKINYALALPEDELMRFIFADRDEIPQTAVFDRDGKLLHKFVGFDLKTKNDLDRAVEEALNQ